jgi:hypothetical protein
VSRKLSKIGGKLKLEKYCYHSLFRIPVGVFLPLLFFVFKVEKGGGPNPPLPKNQIFISL